MVEVEVGIEFPIAAWQTKQNKSNKPQVDAGTSSKRNGVGEDIYNTYRTSTTELQKFNYGLGPSNRTEGHWSSQQPVAKTDD
jgi:hypothetical protein